MIESNRSPVAAGVRGIEGLRLWNLQLISLTRGLETSGDTRTAGHQDPSTGVEPSHFKIGSGIDFVIVSREEANFEV